MSLESELLKNVKNDTEALLKDVKYVKQRPLSVSRTGLYVMSAITMMGTIQTCRNSITIVESMKTTPKMERAQVIGNSTPERYYWVNGERAYVEIDGQPVDQYHPNK